MPEMHEILSQYIAHLYTPGFVSSHEVRTVTQFDQSESVWHFTAAGSISALAKTVRECVNNIISNCYTHLENLSI